MNITAVILCAGISSRMEPLSDKIFFEYLGKSILERKIEDLLLHGIKNICIVGNSLNIQEIKEVCHQHFSLYEKYFSFFIQENLSEGMLGGVLTVENSILDGESLLIVSPNDMLEKHFLGHFLHSSKNSNFDIFICGKKVEKYFPGGYLKLESGKKIVQIVEKPGEGNEPSNFINLVIHLFKKPKKLFKILRSIKENNGNQNDDGYEKALQILFETEKNAEVIEYNGLWQALKYPWHHLDMMNFFIHDFARENISSKAFISKSAIINGKVIIEEGVRIMDYAVIQGPAYIGKNTIVANHSLIRNSHIGENCVVGYSTEIARSYLRQNIHTHQNYIGDSVIDKNVNFGAGTKTGNFRLDEKYIPVKIKDIHINSEKNKLGTFCGQNVRIGINVSLSPGLKIGENSFICPHLNIGENIPKNSFIKPRFQKDLLERRENKCGQVSKMSTLSIFIEKGKEILNKEIF